MQLAEINYLCITASIDETPQQARQNMFNHCLDHLLMLFKQKDYIQAINTEFVTQESHYQWQMIAIFCVVFAILAISMYLMCKFINKNKGDESKKSRGERERHRRDRQDADDDVDYQNDRQNLEDKYVRESDNESGSGFKKEYRVPNRKSNQALRSRDSSSKDEGSKHRLFGENSSAVFGEYDNNSGLNERLLNYSDGTGSQGSK